jgi:hypothetical protein
MGCSKTKATYLQAQFRQLAAIRGNKRANIAVASTILTIGYHMLKEGTTCRELGGDYRQTQHPANYQTTGKASGGSWRQSDS